MLSTNNPTRKLLRYLERLFSGGFMILDLNVWLGFKFLVFLQGQGWQGTTTAQDQHGGLLMHNLIMDEKLGP